MGVSSSKNRSTNANKNNTNGFNLLSKIKSKYILNQIFENTGKKKLRIIKYNKNLQNRLNISIKDYIEEYQKIEIEVIPKYNNGIFINFSELNKSDKSHFHIYFNEDKKEMKRNYFNYKDKVKKIKIIVDYEIKSFRGLFDECKCIQKIKFNCFYRNDITNMCRMFYDCSNLEELDLSNFNTDNVTNMSNMFGWCSSLKILKISNFNTDNVRYMDHLFYGCPVELKNELSKNTKMKKLLCYFK